MTPPERCPICLKVGGTAEGADACVRALDVARCVKRTHTVDAGEYMRRRRAYMAAVAAARRSGAAAPPADTLATCSTSPPTES